MQPNEETIQKRVMVNRPGQRSEVLTERTQSGPRESRVSTGTIAIIAILAITGIGVVLYLVSNRNANEEANRNANLEVASQGNRDAPATTIVQQPAPQAPVIIQQPASDQQGSVTVQQPNQRDSASDDANMQEVATKRLNDDLDMTTVSVTISEARATLTGTVNSAALKAKAEQLVREVRGVKSVDNKIVVSGD